MRGKGPRIGWQFMQLPLDTVRHLAALQNYAKQFDFETKMAEKPVKPFAGSEAATAARLQCDFEANNEKVAGANVAVAAAIPSASSSSTCSSSSCSSSALLLLFCALLLFQPKVLLAALKLRNKLPLLLLLPLPLYPLFHTVFHRHLPLVTCANDTQAAAMAAATWKSLLRLFSRSGHSHYQLLLLLPFLLLLPLLLLLCVVCRSAFQFYASLWLHSAASAAPQLLARLSFPLLSFPLLCFALHNYLYAPLATFCPTANSFCHSVSLAHFLLPSLLLLLLVLLISVSVLRSLSTTFIAFSCAR